MTSENKQTFEEHTNQALDNLIPAETSATILEFPVDQIQPTESNRADDNPFPSDADHQLPEVKSSVRLTKRGRIATGVAALVGVGASVFGVGAAAQNNAPEFEGTHQVTIDEATVTDIAHDHIKGSENDIKAAVNKIVDMNPQVFQNGKAYVESEDLGKEITVPKVEKTN